jgi:hypothetical protein
MDFPLGTHDLLILKAVAPATSRAERSRNVWSSRQQWRRTQCSPRSLNRASQLVLEQRWSDPFGNLLSAMVNAKAKVEWGRVDEKAAHKTQRQDPAT